MKKLFTLGSMLLLLMVYDVMAQGYSQMQIKLGRPLFSMGNIDSLTAEVSYVDTTDLVSDDTYGGNWEGLYIFIDGRGEFGYLPYIITGDGGNNAFSFSMPNGGTLEPQRSVTVASADTNAYLLSLREDVLATAGGLIYSDRATNNEGRVKSFGVQANGVVPIGDGTGAPTLATLTATANETQITNGAGSITIGLPDSVTISGKLTTNSVAVVGTGGAGYITLVAQASNPTAPAAGTLLFHSATTQGFTRMEQDNEATTNTIYGRDNVYIAKNTSGSGIGKGKVVYVTGSTGNVPNIALARANSATTMPSVGTVLDSIPNNNFGQVMLSGVISSINTSSFTAGDQVWVSTATAGALQNTRPGYADGVVQRIGSVLVSGVGNGSILVVTAPFIGGVESGTTSSTYSFAGAVTASAGTVTLGVLAGAIDAGGATSLEAPNGAADVALSVAGQLHLNTTDEQLSFHSAADGEISGEVAIPLIYTKSWSFDPDAVCDGAVDRLFLTWILDEAPEGIIIDEWKISFEADPTTELDADLVYADAMIGVANPVVVDALDTTNGTATEDTDANINGGAAIPNGKVLYIAINTPYTESNHQIMFQVWYHFEED